jgi:peroxin-11C
MCASDVDSLKKSLSTFASKLSETRRVLRLFDDLPMLKYSLHYGFGETENVS